MEMLVTFEIPFSKFKKNWDEYLFKKLLSA
jgi:hypothetical protein